MDILLQKKHSQSESSYGKYTGSIFKALLFSQKQSLAFLILLLSFFVGNNLNAAIITSAATGNWSAGATWVGGVAPQPTDDVIIAAGHTVTLTANATCVNLQIGNGATQSRLTHAGFSLTVNGTVNMFQPTGVVSNRWGIDAGTATVAGLITFTGTNTTTTRISTIRLTTGTLNANGGITFIGSAAATKVIDMSTGVCTLNLKGALTVPANSSTLTVAAGFASTFNYVDNVAQTVNFFSAGGYQNLTTNNTSATGATLSAAITATNVIGNISVNTGLFQTNNFNVAMAASKTLTVALGAAMDAGTSVISFNTTGTATINGLFQTSNTVGFSGSATTAISSTNTPTINLATTSTIEYNNTGATQIVTNRTYNGNLTFTGLSKTVAAGTPIVGKNLTINSGATYNGTINNPTLSVGGDFSNSGIFIQGTGLVTFNGTAAQTILGSSSTTFTNNVTLNNGTGLNITTSPTINGTLTLTAGKITTGSNKVILGSAATIASAAAGRYIYGNLEMFVVNGAAPTKTFAIGDASVFAPVSVVFTGTTTGSGSLIAFTTAGDDIDVSNSGIDPLKSVNRTWTINQGTTPVGGFTSYAATFTFVAGDIDGGANTANFLVSKYSGTTWALETVGTKTALTTQATGMTTFGRCQIGESGIIPITVTTQPPSTVTCPGPSVTIFSNSTSLPAPTVIWQRDPNTGTFVDITAGMDGGIYSNFTTTTLGISAIAGVNNYKYRAVFTNTNGTATSASCTVLSLVPSAAGAISGSTTLCPPQSGLPYSVPAISGATTYVWAYSGTGFSIATGSGTNSITVNFAAGATIGDLTVYASNSCGNGTVSPALTFTSSSIPAAAGSITGSASLCAPQTGLAYSVPAIAGASNYVWAYSGTGFSIASGAGTNSITANFAAGATAGNLTVYGNNGCGGNGTTSPTFAINTALAPSAAGTISGSSTFCTSQSGVAYSVSAISGAGTYVWSYSGTGFSIATGSGTNSITANFSAVATSGNLTVYATNGCGSGTVSTAFAITGSSVPGAAGSITGTSAACQSQSHPYSITPVAGATSYIWAYSGTGMTFDGPTDNILGTFNATASSGNLTVTAVNSCGTGLPSPNFAITPAYCAVPPHNTCSGCHINHSAAGGTLTAVNGNPNLCISCHNPVGNASTKPLSNADKAIPGVSGNSHAWSKPSVNAAFQTNKTTNSEMLLRLPGDSIICSTCHDQHFANTIPKFLRISNSEGELCNNCHTARDVRRYADNVANKGTHPVGIAYAPGSDVRFQATTLPISPTSKVTCSSCHVAHYSTSTNGTILRTASSEAICISCHTNTSATSTLNHKNMSCTTCHYAHSTGSNNIYLINGTINTPNSGPKPVVYTANTSGSNYADGTGTINGVCEVCHTTTDHFTNTAMGTVDARHIVSPTVTCVTCHPHNKGFAAQANCFDCHNAITDKPSIPGTRRQIVDATGNGLGAGGDFKRTSHHVAGGIPNVADCIKCHYMGDHKLGTVKLLDPDLGYLNVITYNPAVPSSLERFCIKCHDQDGSNGDMTPFSDNVTVPFVDSTMWKASAHKGNVNTQTCLSCHDNGHGSNKSTMLSPWNYAGAGTGTDLMNEEEGFCISCHGGTGVASVKVHLAFGYTNTATNFFQHAPTGSYRLHKPGETAGSSFSGANRHVECVDCHNPHGAIAGTATAPALLPTMTGAKGVEPVYGATNTSPGAPTAFTWKSSVTQEYQVCYKCHSSYTAVSAYIPGGILNQVVTANGLKKITTLTNNQIADSRDMAQEYNPNNASYHPVMAAGKNTGILAGAFRAGYSSTTRIYCSSCHNSNLSATAGYGRGPHGSANLHILDKGFAGTAQYNTMHGGAGDNANSVCSKCHTGPTDGGNSRFTKHLYHTGPGGTAKAECYACHDTHGSEQVHLMNFARNEASCITAISGTNTQTSFSHAVGTATNACLVTCHGKTHSAGSLTYNPAY